MRTDNLPVLDLSGSPRHRGRTHGETLRDRIRDTIDRYQESLAKSLEVDPGDYFDHFLGRTNFLPSIERWTPELLEEIRGISEGAGVDERMIFLLQLVDEDWVHRATHHGQRPETYDKCTAFAVTGQKNLPTYAGQNMDIPSWTDGLQVLLKITNADTGVKTMVFTYAGLIALNGMNDVPLGVTCNTLMDLTPCNDGLPVAFVVRRILEQTSMNGAIDLIAKIKHASGQNYILSSRDGIRCFECSANRVVEYKMEPTESRLCHTNHALANDDRERSRQPGPEGSAAKNKKNVRNTTVRLESICSRLGDPSRRTEIEDLRDALSAKDDPKHPVSRELGQAEPTDTTAFTAAASIYDMAAKPRLHLASGPPSVTAFKVFDF